MAELRERYDRLLQTITEYVRTSEDPNITRFLESITEWGNRGVEVEPHQLPAASLVAPSLELAIPTCRQFLSAFVDAADILHWEQSYKKQDNVVSDDMLAGYGFAEIVGKNGPFVSERVRCGIGLWRPGISYAIHRHKAEEIYHVLAGSALFTVGDEKDVEKQSGETMFVNSGTWHGFRTTEQQVLLFYIWQGGDMRELSTFARPHQ